MYVHLTLLMLLDQKQLKTSTRTLEASKCEEPVVGERLDHYTKREKNSSTPSSQEPADGWARDTWPDKRPQWMDSHQ